MLYIDGHCDTLSKALDENKDIYKNDLQFSINKANRLGGGIQTLAAFVDTKAMLARTAAEPTCPLFRVFSPGPFARAQKSEIHIGCCNLEWSRVYWEIERS